MGQIAGKIEVPANRSRGWSALGRSRPRTRAVH